MSQTQEDLSDEDLQEEAVGSNVSDLAAGDEQVQPSIVEQGLTNICQLGVNTKESESATLKPQDQNDTAQFLKSDASRSAKSSISETSDGNEKEKED